MCLLELRQDALVSHTKDRNKNTKNKNKRVILRVGAQNLWPYIHGNGRRLMFHF